MLSNKLSFHCNPKHNYYNGMKQVLVKFSSSIKKHQTNASKALVIPVERGEPILQSFINNLNLTPWQVAEEMFMRWELLSHQEEQKPSSENVFELIFVIGGSILNQMCYINKIYYSVQNLSDLVIKFLWTKLRWPCLDNDRHWL